MYEQDATSHLLGAFVPTSTETARDETQVRRVQGLAAAMEKLRQDMRDSTTHVIGLSNALVKLNLAARGREYLIQEEP